MSDRALTVGTGRCECTQCGRSFGGARAFDLHQRLAGDRRDPTVVCLDPASLGMRRTMAGYWARDVPLFASGVGRHATNGADPGVVGDGMIETISSLVWWLVVGLSFALGIATEISWRRERR